MPLFNTPSGLLFFANVPRTGGSSVEDYLSRRLGQPALLNRRFLDMPPSLRWSRTSPQHVTADEFENLFPGNFVANRMGLVRHPVSRVVSIYKWLRSINPRTECNFDRWLESALAEALSDPWCHDGHLRCQTEFIPAPCRIFRLEEGLEKIEAYVDTLTGERQPQYKVPHSHKSSVELNQISSTAHRLIEIQYAEDFDRFRYSLRPLYNSVSPPVHLPLRMTIFSPANRASAHNWGEAGFSVSLAAALTRKGVETEVRWRDQWQNPPDARSNTLLLRAPFTCPPHQGRAKFIWMLSHFDEVSEEELSYFDHIMTSSPTLAERFSGIAGDRFIFAPQCTDSNQMKPAKYWQDAHTPAVFVGNGKLSTEQAKKFASGDLNVLRPALRLALASGINVAVWGRYGGVKFRGHRGDTLSYRKLGQLYRNAGVILNDHTTDQMEFGSINNRVFDAMASARPVMTTCPHGAFQALPDINNGLTLFDEHTSTVDFLAKFNECLAPDQEVLKELSSHVRQKHSFNARANLIISTLKS